MRAYADTSFVAALYLANSHQAESVALLRAAGGSLLITDIGHLELLNALQLAVFRRQIKPAQAAALAGHIEEDLAAGILTPAPLPADLFDRAKSLALAHSARLGVRSLDVLQVATALGLGADTLLTHDRRQAALARAAGLRARPA